MSDITSTKAFTVDSRMTRRLLAGLAIAVVLLGSSLVSVHADSPRMAIHLRPSGGPETFGVGKIVTLRLAVSGVHLSAAHIGKRASDHQGHIQVYLDQIPRDAYSNPSRLHWLASVGVTTVPLRLTRGILGTTGSHRIIAALARNDNVLYRVQPATFKVLVR